MYTTKCQQINFILYCLLLVSCLKAIHDVRAYMALISLSLNW